MKSRIDYKNKDNVYMKAKRIERYEKYLEKIKNVSSNVQNIVQGDLSNAKSIPEGTKVKLNYDSIVSEPVYKNKVKEYKNFVEKNKDKIFTVQYDEKYTNNPMLVTLKEDKNKVKWLWYCDTDLIVVDDINNNKQ